MSTISGLFMLRYCLSLCQKRFKTSATLSSITFNSTLKKLIDSKQFRKALDLFEQQPEQYTDTVSLNMALKACTKLHDYQRGINISRQLSSNSLNDPFIQTSLIHFYMQCHDIDNAMNLFSTITNKTNYTYGAVFKGFISNKMPEKVFDLFDHMNIQPDQVTLNLLFTACAQLCNHRAKNIGIKLLDQLSNTFQNSNITLNSAIHMLMKFGDVAQAEHLCQTIKNKDVFTYGIMINGYVQNKLPEKALDLFQQMNFKPHDSIYNNIFSACTQLDDHRAKLIANKLLDEISKNIQNNQMLLTSAIHMLMKFGDIAHAERLFQLAKKKDNIIHGAMLKGYTDNNMCEKALDLFEEMSSNLDDIIYGIIFNTCAQLSNDRAKKVANKLLDKISKNIQNNQILLNSAIHMLMKFGDITHAEHLFQLAKVKDNITYGTILRGYTDNNMCEKALDLFEEMPSNSDDIIIYGIIFNTCAQLSNDRAKKIGNKILNQIWNNMGSSDVLLNSGIHMLLKFGDVKAAEDLFQITKKNIIVYAVMMKGYNVNNEPLKCLRLFEEMKNENMIPNEVTFLLVINACSKVGMLSKCESVASQIPLHFYNNQRICNSLINMWGKASSIGKAQEIFQSMKNRDGFIYNTMINVFGLNRMGLEAVDLYETMPKNFRDEVTHICVLNACSHSGLLSEADSIFNHISNKTEKIVTVMIDCFSRLFLFNEAQQLIDDYEKSNSPDLVMHMALLSGARNSNNSVLAEKVYHRMKCSFPDEREALISASILLCNIYSALGDNEQSETVRLQRLKQFGKKVKPGLVWTELNGEIYEFKAHDMSHPRSKEIHNEMKRISSELIEHGHKYNSSWITRSMRDGESVESILCGHSEKLAIAFHFIQQSKPSFIQITKNLRVCGDCHQATKLIAKIRQCHIVVRDANCIHHFYPNGNCSCQDHF